MSKMESEARPFTSFHREPCSTKYLTSEKMDHTVDCWKRSCVQVLFDSLTVDLFNIMVDYRRTMNGPETC